MRASGAWAAAVLMAATTILAGCLGGLNGVGPTAGDLGDDLDLDGGAPWVLDAARNRLPADAYPGEVPAFDIVKTSDRISGEPTIGVSRTGAVFYPAIDFDAVGGLPMTRYMRSTDGGETWEDVSPQMAGVETHPTTFDPYVYVDPTTGRVYALDMGPHVACNKVSWSDDDGETWVTRDGACIPGANDHPSLWAGPATPLTNTAVYPNQLYLCTNQITDSLCYQSSNGGLDWFVATPSYLGYDPHRLEVDPTDPEGTVFSGLCGGLHGHGHTSWADGTVYLGRDWCGEPSVAVSRDGGLTWDRAVLSADPRHDPADHDISVGTDSEGTAYAFWVGNDARAVYLSRSFDRGYTWSTPINVTAPGVTAVKLPSLVAGAEGRIAFLYVGTEEPLGWQADDMKEGCDDADDPECYEHPEAYNRTTWNAYVGTSLNADADDPVFATVLANDRDAPLKRGGCNGRCFGDEGGMYDFLDIDIDPTTGQVWVALVDVCSGDCDGPDKGKFTVEEKAVGAAARLMSGTPLLEAPIPER